MRYVPGNPEDTVTPTFQDANMSVNTFMKIINAEMLSSVMQDNYIKY